MIRLTKILDDNLTHEDDIPCDKFLDPLPGAKLVVLHPNLPRIFLRFNRYHCVELHPWILLLDSFQRLLVLLQEHLPKLSIHSCLHPHLLPLDYTPRKALLLWQYRASIISH
jgi:hypothetical protein